MYSTARFETTNGRKYLVQLCKHFAHKVEVRIDGDHGECALPPGLATLDADDSGLVMKVSAETREGLTQAKTIVESHLIRFAFREELTQLDWLDEADSQEA